MQSLQGDRTVAFQEERKRLLAFVRPSAVSPSAVAHGKPSSSNAEDVLCASLSSSVWPTFGETLKL